MIKKLLKSLLSPIGKGLLIFAVFGAAVYVYAAVEFPDETPGPVSGVVGMYVGISDTARQGNFGGSADGYKGVNAECTSAFADSHICTAEEMINSYNHNNVPTLTTGRAWINNGPPGDITSVVNDCQGWNSNLSTVFGSIWVFAGDKSSLTPCNQSLKFACCK